MFSIWVVSLLFRKFKLLCGLIVGSSHFYLPPIGGGNLRRALLVLIASILEYHEDTVIEMASESLKRISMESNKWVLASAIGSKIWVGHNNLEDLETLLNTSGMGLVDEIHEVSMGFHSC